ncbi:MAG TPA: PIG-L family deacetylase [Ilumatobacteraceae bacterium]|nr:PIG-L family deacetylase [Ilumatobacteraceae bacterium]
MFNFNPSDSVDSVDDRHLPNRARAHVRGAAPHTVFDFVCDLDQLPRWNTAVVDVVSRPNSLARGAVWKVAMRDGPLQWVSRSTVVEYDPDAMVFVYRSGTDDGNDSYTEWRWSTTAEGDDTIVEVSWRLVPRTALRRWLMAPYRARRLRGEVPASLAALVREFTIQQRPDGRLTPDAHTTVLGVWAHPDDEAYLSATLMHRVRAAGGRVVVVTATLGGAGLDSMIPEDAKAVRHRELKAALAAVDVHEHHVLGHADGGCTDVALSEGADQIEDLIREVRPDVIITFGPDGITGHLDHVAVSRWTITAWQRTGLGELLLATMTDEFRMEHEGLHELLGISMGPPLQSVPEHDVALRVVPSAEERARKRLALDAHHSQTAPLAELLGYTAFHDWWVDECFRAPSRADLAWAAPAPATGAAS